MKILFAPFKLTGKIIKTQLKRTRQAWNLQLHDDYWPIILWIKTWAFIFGITAGIAVYHYLIAPPLNA